jgi:hypothetical protein
METSLSNSKHEGGLVWQTYIRKKLKDTEGVCQDNHAQDV